MLYYTDEFIELHHGSCLELQEWLAADVLISDPPYGMAYQSGQRTERMQKIANDGDAEVRDAALALWGDKPSAVFGTWKCPRPTSTQQLLVWHKQGVGPGMGDLSLAFGTSHEEIYLTGRWEKRTKRRGSVITTDSSPSALTSRVGHPTPKPTYLMEVLISEAPPGVIADPFAGSGSTLIAARNLGRKAIGVIARRLSNETQLGFDIGA